MQEAERRLVLVSYLAFFLSVWHSRLYKTGVIHPPPQFTIRSQLGYQTKRCPGYQNRVLFFIVGTNPIAAPVLHMASVSPDVKLLGTSFNFSLVGGAPFCSSGFLGTILCYPPSFLKAAYNFPSTTGPKV